jgi:Replication-relaxation
MSRPESASGRVDSDQTTHLVKRHVSAKSANDSVEHPSSSVNGQAPRRRYVTAKQVERMVDAVNDRQRSILIDVHRLGVVTAGQLQRLFYAPTEAGRRVARQELRALADWQALTRMKRPIGGIRAGSAGYAYGLGPAGQRLVNPGRPRYRQAWTPQPAYLRHAVAVSEVYVRLREAERRGLIELAAFDSEPVCWRPFTGPGGGRIILKPDAFTVIYLGDFEERYLIEVDCGTEPGPRISAKARTYIRYFQTGREQERTGIFPFVLWICTTADRAEFLVRTLAALPAEHWQLFQVTTLAQTVEHIGGVDQTTTNRKEVNQ